ncbi:MULTISPECIES: DUF2784 domain-containing protein [Halomonadaceae]|uniref:DUF2784 domain-containing protein n=1 Tax=Vreelandella titanicae TaxID=664683 RepID=A0A558J688_9GAMM|nr:MULTISPECIES: DUF2784 domain-containing protein [Halomonas]QNU61715.1 DUF2784 domain-containing protein [Halomonas titanicae]TVU89064.1 DUF2784 domain-containing protein [Halomonas titanicae]CEP36475.1 Putative uncharacterized protein [Halomonas sp. R57-5]
MPPSLLLMLADTLLILHVLFVAFVVLGLVAIYAGYFFNWRWVRNKTFRIVHLCAIGYVVVQAWLGVVCPLTTWEMALRAEAGAATYSGSFIQYWLHSLLYFTLPEWVFVVVYTLFGSLVLASWFVVKPRQHSS